MFRQDADRYQQSCSTTHAPTLHQVIPALETLISRWEAKLKNPKYAIFHDALRRGLEKLRKYYKRLDNVRAYILALCKSPPFSIYVRADFTFRRSSSLLQAAVHRGGMGT